MTSPKCLIVVVVVVVMMGLRFRTSADLSRRITWGSVPRDNWWGPFSALRGN